MPNDAFMIKWFVACSAPCHYLDQCWLTVDWTHFSELNKFQWTWTQIARFMWPTWGPPGSCRPQVGPMNLAIRGIKIQFSRQKMNFKPFSTKSSHDDELILSEYFAFCIKRFIYSLWSRDAIWWHGSRSTWARGMACWLMAPSHYVNQCWLLISEVLWHSHGANFAANTESIDKRNVL